jgi:3-oxoacid CoA-transferase
MTPWVQVAPDSGNSMSPAETKRHQMARRAAKELKDGMYCNLGIGVPTLAANYIPKGI